MSNIFICYSRTDSAVTGKLAKWLRADWAVFTDIWPRVGRRYDEFIEKELDRLAP